ncbi:Acetylornithine aminotransferase [bacterium HR15]|nr:Acetylornithine aminotransferase [bacterium HR15]
MQAQVWALDQQRLMQTYRRQPVLFVRGEGAYLYDTEGNRYLDFLAGVAVCNVGHCHPHLVARVQQQAAQLMHISNLLLSEPQARLADRLCELTGMERAFFCNCGAEACETAIKIARKYANTHKSTPDYEILVLEGSFHGRTMGAVSATIQPKYQQPFVPLLPCFRALPRNDLSALREAFSERTAAIFLEPIQGESGVNPLTDEYLLEAQSLCQRYNALFMIDEVQTGMGRTGKWFAYQHLGLMPDVVTLAKGLGGGFPIGACLARGIAAEILQVGDHGSTFGGNPLACTAALATIEIIEQEQLCERAARVGNYLRQRLLELQHQDAPIQEVRGRGLLIGVQLTEPIARTVVDKAFEQRLIINPVGDWILRLAPPLVITEHEVDAAIATLQAVLREVRP